MADKPKNEIEKIKEYQYAMHNYMVQKTSYSLTAKEFDIIRLLMTKIKPDDKELKPVTFSMREFCLLTGIDPDTPGNYTYIKDTIEKILQKVVIAPFIKQDGEEVDRPYYWIEPSTMEMGRKDGTITLQLAKVWEPWLIDLVNKGNYLTTQYGYTLSMKSVYGKRLYEILVSHLDSKNPKSEKQYRYSLDQLRRLLLGPVEKGKKPKYTNFSDFEKRVLRPAKDDLDRYGLVYMEYEPKKTGRSYTHVVIYFRWNTYEERLQKEEENPVFTAPEESRRKIKSVDVEEVEPPEYSYFLYMFNGDQDENAAHACRTEEEFIELEHEEKLNAFTAELEQLDGLTAGEQKEQKQIASFTINEEKAVETIKKVYGLDDAAARKYAQEINPFKRIPEVYVIGDIKGAIEKMKEYKENGTQFEVITMDDYEKALTAELLIDLGIIEIREKD